MPPAWQEPEKTTPTCTTGFDDAEKKYERHDFKKIWAYGPEIKAKFGEEGVAEYIEHLREDIENKIGKLVPEQKEVLKDAFIYFGFSS